MVVGWGGGEALLGGRDWWAKLGWSESLFGRMGVAQAEGVGDGCRMVRWVGGSSYEV